MGSRRKAGCAVARLPESLAPETDHCIAACNQWLSIAAELDRLSIAWSQAESRMLQKVRLLELTERERKSLPEIRALDEIDARLTALDLESRTLLKAVKASRASSPAGVIARLKVASALVHPDDHSIAHALIVEAASDLQALQNLSSLAGTTSEWA